MGANAGGEVLQELCLAPPFPPALPTFPHAIFSAKPHGRQIPAEHEPNQKAFGAKV